MQESPGVSSMPWHPEETPIEEVVVVIPLRNLIYVAVLQAVVVLHQAQLHLVLQLLSHLPLGSSTSGESG